MSLKIIKEEADSGTLTIQLDNGDYKVLNEIVQKWRFKDRENALRFALAILSDTENGTLARKREDGAHSLLVPTDEILEAKNGSKNCSIDSEGSFNSHEEAINYLFPKKKIILLPSERIASRLSDRRIEAKNGYEFEIWYPTPKDAPHA